MIQKFSTIVRDLLPENQFARSVGTLVGGAAGSQLLVMVTAPIVTRLFSPEDFGLLAVYAGLLGMLTSIASLRYEVAIVLPEDKQEAANLAVLSLLIVAAMSALTVIVALLGNTSIPAILGVPALSHYFWLLPIGVFAVGSYQVFSFWALRTKSFTAISGTRLKQSLTLIAIQLIGYPLGAVALLIGHAAGQGMGGFSLGKAALRHLEFRHVRFSGIAAAAKRYRRFPIYSTWSGLFNSAGVQLPALMFAALFNPAAAGLYVLTNRILSMPMWLIGGAIGDIFFTNAADAYREKRLAALVAVVYEKLAQIAMPPALVLLIAGPDLFAFVFGENWREAGVFAQWLAPWLYIGFVGSPLSALFDVMEKQGLELFFETLLFVMRIVAIVAGALTGSLTVTIALFSISGVISRVIRLIWIAICSGNTLASLIKPTATALIWSIICAIPLALGLWMPQDGHIWLVGLAVTGLLISSRFFYLLRKTGRHTIRTSPQNTQA